MSFYLVRLLFLCFNAFYAHLEALWITLLLKCATKKSSSFLQFLARFYFCYSSFFVWSKLGRQSLWLCCFYLSECGTLLWRLEAYTLRNQKQKKHLMYEVENKETTYKRPKQKQKQTKNKPTVVLNLNPREQHTPTKPFNTPKLSFCTTTGPQQIILTFNATSVRGPRGTAMFTSYD